MKEERIKRPHPPVELLFDDKYMFGGFLPAPNVNWWIENTFLNPDSPLFNEEHLHLLSANIKFLYTNVQNVKQGRRILGTTETPMIRGGKWQKERQLLQFREWFGTDNFDFLITLDANYCVTASDIEFFALLDHELYHCGHAKDAFGQPKFSRDTGKPKLFLRGHDIEEFLGIYRRYGTFDEASKEITQIGIMGGELNSMEIAKMCGTCLT